MLCNSVYLFLLKFYCLYQDYEFNHLCLDLELGQLPTTKIAPPWLTELLQPLAQKP
jgi:hypothetical protein